MTSHWMIYLLSGAFFLSASVYFAMGLRLRLQARELVKKADESLAISRAQYEQAAKSQRDAEQILLEAKEQALARQWKAICTAPLVTVN